MGEGTPPVTVREMGVGMGTSRARRQLALFIGLLAGACLAVTGCLLFVGVAGATDVWPLAALGAGCLVGSALYIFGQGSIPTSADVAVVAKHIAAVRERGVGEGSESCKGHLHFYLPADWRYQKVGKEGWLIYPRGLGALLTISIWAFDAVPSFSAASRVGLVRNAADLARRQGFIADETTAHDCQIAGQSGLSYGLKRGGRHCAQGYLWRYEGGDYLIVVEASGAEHLSVVNPAIDEFIRGLFMWRAP
jgi:hypothetical protein